MFEKNQQQKGGKGSINNQAARDVIIHHGLTYSDAREIALDIFKANFLQLSEYAAETARSRAESLVNSFLNKLSIENQEAITNIQDPDVQFAIYSAQKEYARSGEKDLENILVNLLIERIQEKNNTLRKIILNESINTSSLLTSQQLDLLTIIFLIRETYNPKIRTVKHLKDYILKYLKPFVHNLVDINKDCDHLLITKCCTLTEYKLENAKLHFAIHLNYLKIFSKTTTVEQLKHTYFIVNSPKKTNDQGKIEYPDGVRVLIDNHILSKPNKDGIVSFNIMNETELAKKLIPLGFGREGIDALMYGFRSTGSFSIDEILELNEFRSIENLLINSKICERIHKIKLSSVGSTLGLMNFKSKIGNLFNSDELELLYNFEDLKPV